MRLIEDAAGVKGREVIPRVIPVASPAAGLNFSVTCPGGALWYPESIVFHFTASAVVATRAVSLQVADADNNIIGIVTSALTVPATNIGFFSFTRTCAALSAGANNRSVSPIPMRFLLGGWTLGTNVSQIDVGDTFTTIFVTVLEVEERPYDTELARDIAAIRGATSNAYPEIREGL